MSKLAWALVSKRGKIDIDTIREKKEHVKDAMSIFDEETGYKVKRVKVVVIK